VDLDFDRIIPDHHKSLRQGAIAPFQMPAYKEMQDGLEKHGPKLGLKLDVPWSELTPAEKLIAIDGKKSKGLHGIKDLFEWLEKRTYKMHIRVFLSRWRAYRKCDTCQGQRLKPESLAVKLADRCISQLCEMPLENLAEWLDQVALNHQGHPALVRVVCPIEIFD
jgi:excinuclease ABC subunit A